MTQPSASADSGGALLKRRDLAVHGAMEVLAEHGARGLTHRQVDRHLNWPLGSTSNYFQRRNDMFTAVALHILRLDAADLGFETPDEISLDVLVARTTGLFEKWMSPSYRTRMRAGAEVLFESTRNSEVGQFVDAQIQETEILYQNIFQNLNAPDPVGASKSFRLLMSSMYVGVSINNDFPDKSQMSELVKCWASTSVRAPDVAHRP